MKERIIALLSAILIALSFTMPVHAAIAVTPDMVSIAYDLLGSMGVIAAMEGTHAQKYDSVEDWITSPNANVASMLDELETWGTITSTDTGAREFHFDLDADLERVGELLGNLYTAVADYCVGVFNPPTDITDVTVGDVIGTHVLGVCSGSPYIYGKSASPDAYSFRGLTADGYYHEYYVRVKDGTKFFETTEYAGTDATLTLVLSGYSDVGCTVSFSVQGSSLKKGGSYKVEFADPYYFLSYGGAGTAYSDGMAVDIPWPADNVGDNFDKEALIPADVWAGGFTDSLARGQDVVLRLPGSLAGYDDIATVYDPEAGLVAGVDIPGYVDSGTGVITGAGEGDLTHDFAGVVSGIGSLGSKLTDILSKIAALPALLAAALVGTGSLDFSGFQSIELYNKFPFCIPWDLKNCFVDFNVSPLEPKFVYDFSGTPLSAAGTVEIDLTKFDSLFQIVRYFVFAGFAVGLIVITRNLIRG